MNEKTSANRAPPLMLYRLCSTVTGITSETALQPHFQHALRILASNITSGREVDEFQIAEKIKRKLARQSRARDGALFSESYRKLQALNVPRQRGPLLQLLLSLSQENSSSARDTRSANFNATFAQSLPALQFASTPFHPGNPPLRTPHLASGRGEGLHMPRQTPAHLPLNFTSSTKTSGISSMNTGERTSSTIPSHSFQTPAVSSRLPFNLGSAGNVQSTFSRTLLTSDSDTLTAASSKEDVVVLPGLAKPRYPLYNNSDLLEMLLLRDVVYVFQGIEGKYIKLDPGRDRYRVSSEVKVPSSQRTAANKLAECGWLFSKLKKYTESKTSERAFGLVGQSFCAAVHEEMTDYYRLLAVLDAQLQQEQDLGIVADVESFTLRQLSIWMIDPSVRLKTLAALVDVCKGKKGGALASTIHSYMQHGDPFVKELVKHTLTMVAQPIFVTLMRWIYDGELDDTFHEFFVASDPSVREDRLWHDKYSLRKSMIPSFITMDQARKILLTGKSINFLRQVCHDRTPIKGRELIKKAETKNADSMFTQDLDGHFQKMIDVAYKEISRHLLDVLHSKYKFMDHLKAMRRYLLLGQGDFIRHLMDLLEEDLAKPASCLFVHNLMGILETAIRATNAQFDDSDILKRVDVRMLEISPGDTGWDVFSLDYHVDGPISTVFTPESIIMYLRVFNFLWRAKRMEYILSNIWRAQMANTRPLLVIRELQPVLHHCHLISSEMIHFIQQVQYYINFEVLSCSWDELLRKVQDAGDLDNVIAAHQEFLDTIIARSLLDDLSRGTILTQLRTIFDLIIQFQMIQDTMYQSALDEVERRNVFDKRVEQRLEQDEWGMTSGEQEEEKRRRSDCVDKLTSSTRGQLRVLAQSYQDMVQQFLLMLNGHTDASLRFLSFRLDFNEHYKSREPRLRTSLCFSSTKKAFI